jgi:putative endonuclease
MDKSRFNKGQTGEDTAVDFLTGSGIKILDRNYRCPPGEIDIIAKDGQSIIFVEVRTRQAKGLGTPEESITFRKRMRLVRAAQWYLKQRKLYNFTARFDVVTIRWNGENPEINWIVNAFEAGSR